MRFAWFVMWVLVSACTRSVVPPPTLHDFGLVGEPKNADSTAQITVTAPGWLDDGKIRFRLLYHAASQVRAYNLDKWLAPAPELLQQHLLRGGIGHNRVLDMELLEFEQQFSTPQQAEASLRIRARAFGPDGTLIAGRQFVLKKACPSADAKGAVTALVALTNLAASQINLWLTSLHYAP